MGRSTRHRIAKGIYADRAGISAFVWHKGKPVEKRYPDGTPLRTMQQWQRDEQATQERSRTDRRGTLNADMARYIEESKHLASWVELRSELRAWAARYGTWPRWKITGSEVKKTRVAWLETGLKPKTINNRVDALRRLYRALDGKRAATPCDEIDPLAIPSRKPAPVDLSSIQTTYNGLLEHEQRGLLRDRKTRARFMILATTGARPSELMRAQPDDVNLQRGVWLTRDGKGGYRPHALVLNDDMLIAWRLFIDAEAWGAFNTGSFARTLRHCGWPADIRPYGMRRTVGITLSEAGVDLQDVGAFLGHTQLQTTRSAYVPVLNSRMSRASHLLAGRFGFTDADIQKGGQKHTPADSGILIAHGTKTRHSS